MTATVTLWPDRGAERIATETLAVPATPPSRVKRTSSSGGTAPEAEALTSFSEQMPIDRIYPHLFDQEQKTGQALIHIRSAIGYTQASIDAFGEPDLVAVGGYLAQVATALSAAYLLTEFNPSLGGVVAFIRRAVLAVHITDISRSRLNTLQFALRSLNDNPMLDLDDAADVIDRLEKEGWCGEHALAEKIISALLDDSGLDENGEPQNCVFVNVASPSE